MTARTRHDDPAPRPLCAVTLIDRRTGRAHRINGAPLQSFSRDPDESAAALLAGRDRDIWDARIQPLPETTAI